MSLVEAATRWIETTTLPDPITRAGIALLAGRTGLKLSLAGDGGDADFARDMALHPIAEKTGAADARHNELPAAFFAHCLGPRRKYSACLYPTGGETLAQAEAAALAETVAHANLADGQMILELGCGWGSLTLYVAELYPNALITAVSNSQSQRDYIEAEVKARDLRNVRIVTADMNDFATAERFDRVVSVEMFEHMANWEGLLRRVRSWLNPEGRLFLHVFTHNIASYRFDHGRKADWIARHFFTGGIIPSHSLIRHFPDLFAVEEEWRWNGRHYKRTALHWLENYDRNIAAIRPILVATYGSDAGLWERRWRLFFLATAGLFGHRGGKPWAVSHYRLKAV